MGFGFSKDFVIFLIISALVAVGTENWKSGAAIMIVFAVCKVIWNILTK